MKPLLAALLLLLTLTTHAQTWPRNPTTGKVEFRGVLPWPAGVKTEAQRRALVRRWYLSKLTVLSPAQVAEQEAANKTNGLLTYAGLPKVVTMRQGSGNEASLLCYFARLSSSIKGLNYQFTHFDLQRASDVEKDTPPTPVEQLLSAAPAPNEKAALAALRKRLAVALAGW